jgi:hypothetical protein
LPQYGSHRLMADAEVRGEFTQGAVAGRSPDRRDLIGGQLPPSRRLVRRPTGATSRSARRRRGDDERAWWQNALDGPIPIASALSYLTNSRDIPFRF